EAALRSQLLARDAIGEQQVQERAERDHADKARLRHPEKLHAQHDRHPDAEPHAIRVVWVVGAGAEDRIVLLKVARIVAQAVAAPEHEPQQHPEGEDGDYEECMSARGSHRADWLAHAVLSLVAGVAPIRLPEAEGAFKDRT